MLPYKKLLILLTFVLLVTLVLIGHYSTKINSGDSSGLSNLPKIPKEMQWVIEKCSLQRIAYNRSERFKVKSSSEISNQDYVEETSHYISFDPPVELVTYKISGSSYPATGTVLKKLRLGYPSDGYLFSYENSNTINLNKDGKVAYWVKKFGNSSKYYPYDVNYLMDKDEILKRFKRPYFTENIVLSEKGSGYIDFSIDTPRPPFPIIVWFNENHVCGIDLIYEN